MLPDGEPGSDSKPSSSHASTADERVESIPDGDEGEEVSDEAGENNENTNDGDENSDAASNEDAALSPSDPEDSSDMFSDDDSDMSYVEDSDPDDQEVREALPVPLPEEFAELTAGREDAVDDDDVVQAILRAREKHSEHPPSIEIEDGVASISFHPKQQLLAVGTFTGDVSIYGYSNEACELKNTHELHLKAIRDIEFSKDGSCLVSSSKDKSILVTDVETGKLKNAWDNAHSSPVHALYILDENRLCSGCEEGYVKLWDTRQKEPIFSIQAMEDIVNAIVSTSQNRHIAVACGGVITSINVMSRKIHAQSEEYDHDFTSLGVFRHETKLLAGSSKGSMYLFNWGEFGYHSDEVAGFKQPMSCMLAVSESCVVSGWEDGKIRANHLFPHQALGVVGQHSFSVEVLDISNTGELIASAAAAGGHVKFWNIKYLEEMEIFCEKQRKKKKKAEHNLPSSNTRNAADFFADMA